MNARKHVKGRLLGWDRARRGLWGLLALGFLVALTAAETTRAQVTSPGKATDPLATTYLTVTSDPPGVVVKLTGEYELVGTTPWKVFRPISGVYRVEATAPGYGSWSRTVVLGPTGVQDLHVKLGRKSRFAAAARGLVFPGWGQHYNESSGKRNVVWIAEAGALVALYAFWERYQGKKDDFDDVAEIYRDSRNIDAIPILRRELERRDKAANDAYDTVEKLQLLAYGIYGLAFLDALFSGPPEAGSPLPSRAELEDSRTPGASLGWAASVGERESRVGLRLNF